MAAKVLGLCAVHLSRRRIMDAVIGVRGYCTLPSTAAFGSAAWRLKRGRVKYWTRHACLSPSATLEDKANNLDISQVQEQLPSRDKWTVTGRDDVVKLFNVTQQNMLYLNKERVIAMDELQKVQRDKDFLLARVAQLEAEYRVSAGECDMLHTKLNRATGGLWTSGSQGSQAVVSGSTLERRHRDPFSIWSELLLRIDLLAMTGAITLGQASTLRNLVRKRDAQAADVYMNMLDKDDQELSRPLLALLSPNKRRGVHVVHICTEMAPIARAGSLAAYISRLCQALRKRGHLVEGLQNTRIVFTCHDFKYQCLQEPEKLSLCGLDPKKLHQADRLQDNFETTLVNVLKGGIIYSNKVTTVSPLCALDVLTKEHGNGLDSTLTQHLPKSTGVLNGVDYSMWDPRVDPLIPAKYSIEDISGKAVCKYVLRKSLQLPDLEKPKPLIGCIAPSVTHQDLEPLKTALGIALSKGSQFVFVGATKLPGLQAVLEDLQQENKNCHFAISYDDSVAHQVLAASDILICPCIFDPSGQWPLIAMTYGTVPVAREVYGGCGSIIDVDEVLGDKPDATGFNFCSTQSSDLANALIRALDRLEANPDEWAQLIQNGMNSNNSWDGKCVESYEAAYFSICSS